MTHNPRPQPTAMQHITDAELRRRLALGLTIPPPAIHNRKRRFQQNSAIGGLLCWLAGWISALAYVALTGK